MLVLDEATSALDAATEAEIMETLRVLSADRTVVMVTHRLANLAVCDRVLVMREGRLSADAPSDGMGGAEPAPGEGAEPPG